MKYLLLELDKEKYWFEIEDDNYANRQIVFDEYNEFHVSCLEDCLAENPIIEAYLEGDVKYLTKHKFENVWQSVLKKYVKRWEKTKKKYSIGTCVQGICKYFYPQGSIIIGKDFIAVYKGNESICINKSVKCKIKLYDDTNMWLVVEKWE